MTTTPMTPPEDEPQPQTTGAGGKHTADLHRLLRIIMLVQGQPDWTPKRLAEEFGKTERTIYRDIDKLRTVGVPIDFDHQSKGYRIAETFFLQPLQFTPDEALALAALCGAASDTENAALTRPAARARAKIEAQLPPDLREQVEELAGHLGYRAAPGTPTDDYADVYDRLRGAIAKRTAVLCAYEPSRGRGTRDTANAGEFEFEPYALFFSVRAWYAIGRRSDRDDLRSLKLARFTMVRPTNRYYEIPENFSVRGYLGNAWGMIRGTPDYQIELRFEPRLADTIIETRWHHTQETEEHEDGSVTFRATVSGLDEIVWWVLSMGPSCEVIAPPELAERVRDLAEQTARRYTGSP